MSLQNLGELSRLIKLVKASLTNNGRLDTALGTLLEPITKFKTMDTTKLAKMLDMFNFDSVKIRNVLGVIGKDAKDIDAAIMALGSSGAKSVADLGKAFDGLKVMAGKAKDKIGDLLVKLGSFATSPSGVALIGLAATIGIGLVAIKSEYDKSFAGLSETLDEFREKTDQTANEISDAQKTLAENVARINELKAQGNAYENSEEIEQLEQENSLLEAQIAYRESLLRMREEAEAKAASDVLNSYYESYIVAEVNPYYDPVSGQVRDNTIWAERTLSDSYQADVLALRTLRKEHIKTSAEVERLIARKNQLEANGQTGSDEWKDLNGQLEDYASNMEDIQSQILDLDASTTEKKEQLLSLYGSLFYSDGTIIQGYEGLVEELQSLLPELTGANTVLQDAIQGVKDKYFFGLDEDSLGSLKGSLVKDFNDWIDSLSEEDQAIIYTLSLNTESANWSLSEWKESLQDTKEYDESFSDLEAAIDGVASSFEDVTDAKSKFDAAMEAPEKDANFKSYADAFATLNEQFKAGTTNSNAFWAAAEFLFGSDQLAAWGWSDGLDQIYQAMQNNKTVFEDTESAGLGFLERLHEMSEAGQLLGENGEQLISIVKNADGSFDFDLDGANIEAIADKMNLSKEAVLACLEALSMWGDVNFYDIDEVIAAIDKVGISAETAGGKAVNLTQLTEQLKSFGKTDKEIHDIIEALEETDGITLIDATENVDGLISRLTELGLVSKDGVTVNVDFNAVVDTLHAAGFAKEEIESLISTLSSVDSEGASAALEYVDTLTFDNVTSSIDDVTGALDNVDSSTTDNVVSEVDDITTSTTTATGAVKELATEFDKLDGKKVTMAYDVVGSHIGFGISSFADGTRSAPEGEALVGEEGIELWQSGDQARLVGTNGPEIVDLNKGDRIWTASQTKRILNSSRSVIRGSIPAYRAGLRNDLEPHMVLDADGDVTAPAKTTISGNVSGNDIGSSNNRYPATSNSGSGSSGDERKLFDWIEVAVKRLSDAISKLKDVTSSAYKSLKTKLGAAADAITLVNEQIAVQQQAYDRYMQEAESVGLSDELKLKVQTGEIDLSEYDSDTQDLIKEYQDLYEKALDSADAVEELHEQLADLYAERFDNIQEDYNKKLENLEHVTTMLEHELDESIGSERSKIFDNLYDTELEKIELLTQELNDLEKAYEDALAHPELFEAGSDGLHEMEQAIHDVQEELAETKEKLEDLYEEQFEDIQNNFDNRTDILDHAVTQIENEIELLEAKGQTANEEYYKALQDLERQRIEMLEQELVELEQTLADALASKEIEEGDEKWFAMKSSIEDVKEEIQEANIALEEYNNTMRELEWEAFDKQQEAISDTIDSTNYELDLLDGEDLVDKNGNITAAGYKSAELHAKNYSDYMAQANAYAKEIERIDAELAANPNDEALIERRKELLELQRESTLAAKEEKQAIEDLNEEAAELRREQMQEALEEQAEAAKEALEDELDAMKKLIDAQKEALDEAKDLYEYNKKINELTDNIGDIEKQLSAYEGDDSEETKATVQKLKEELKAANEDLEEAEYDKYISDQKKMLDDIYDQYEENINNRIDEIDATLERQIDAIEAGTDSTIDSILTGCDDLGADLDDTTSVIDDKIDSTNDILEDILENTKQILDEAAQGEVKDYTTDQFLSNDDGTPADFKNGKTQNEVGGSSTGGQNIVVYSDDPDKKIKAYASGGLVDYTGLAWVDGKKTDPESFLDSEDTKNIKSLADILKQYVNTDLRLESVGGHFEQVIPNIIGMSDIASMAASLREKANDGISNSVGDIQINIPIEHVQDYNDFVTQLRNDPKFEKMVNAMTIGRLSGGNSLTKNKYNWK